MGILEGKDYETFDMDVPFICEIVEDYCGSTDSSDVTKKITMYVKMHKFMFRRQVYAGWSEV